jgi:hypothetical protein
MSKITSMALMKDSEVKSQELSIIEQVVMQGDLSKLTSEQRVLYYNKVCESSGLNPFTRPFDYISLNGKLTLYAKKDATEQLRKLNGISIEKLESQIIDDLYIVKATARTQDGRVDTSTGAVALGNLRGDAKANAIMKAETKAKRRVTLSISGMGWNDETEMETIPGAKPMNFDVSSGEFNAKISIEQAAELNMILGDCDAAFRQTMYFHLQKQFKINNLTDIPVDKFQAIKNSAVENMEKNRQKQIEVKDVVNADCSPSVFSGA